MRSVRRIGALALILTALAAPARADASPAKVAALQRAGHGPGRTDGLFGPLTEAAVRRAQQAAGIGVDGIAGPETLRALRGGEGAGSGDSGSAPSGPARFLRPVPGPIGDPFGAPRNGYTHTGVDFPEPEGNPIAAAGVGTVIYAAYNGGGYGNLVVIQHRLGYTSWYGHMSRITAYVGEDVVGGTRFGYVGSTGDATGPHLHFEVRHYDTPINPVPLLLSTVARPAGGARRGPSGGCDGVNRGRRGNWIAAERLCGSASAAAQRTFAGSAARPAAAEGYRLG
jgi:murein DD-endopeptidase MepM/ murein hydrolase activator NlpD